MQPTVLIGTSARGGAFTEDIIQDMAAHADRPVIMPMSNPTELAEARPADLIEWTGGQGAGGERRPVPAGRLPGHGLRDRPGQQRAGLPRPRPWRHRGPRQQDHRRHAERGRARGGQPRRCPAPTALRCCPMSAPCATRRSMVAIAVAEAAIADGVATATVPGDLPGYVQALMWQPVYRPVRSA